MGRRERTHSVTTEIDTNSLILLSFPVLNAPKRLAVGALKKAQGHMHQKRDLHSHNAKMVDLRTSNHAEMESVQVGDAWVKLKNTQNHLERNNAAVLACAILACAEAESMEPLEHTQAELEQVNHAQVCHELGIPTGLYDKGEW